MSRHLGSHGYAVAANVRARLITCCPYGQAVSTFPGEARCAGRAFPAHEGVRQSRDQKYTHLTLYACARTDIPNLNNY